jgi:hypothetical protein
MSFIIASRVSQPPNLSKIDTRSEWITEGCKNNRKQRNDNNIYRAQSSTAKKQKQNNNTASKVPPASATKKRALNEDSGSNEQGLNHLFSKKQKSQIGRCRAGM